MPGALTRRFSPAVTLLNSPQFLAGMTGTDLARRKPGVQIPSPPPPTLQVRAPPASSRRRSLQFRPRCGRKLKPQCSPEALRDQPTQAQASHNDHVAWSPPAAVPDGRTSHASSLSRSAWPTANHLPRRPSDPPLAQHGLPQLRGQAPTSGRRRAVTDMAGDHPTPAIPSRAAAGPPPRPRDLIAVGHRGRRNARTPGPDTGHLDARTPAPDTGHVDRHPWDTGRSHRTLDTGCRTRTRTR